MTLSVPDGEPVEADSALLIMTLGASCGDLVIVSSDDEDAAKAIATLVAQDLDDPSYEG